MASEYIGGGIVTPQVDSSAPHNTVAEIPAPIQQMQPPASNSGSDDPTAGIAKDAGGLSSTAGINSPVTSEDQQTVVGSVLEYAFGKRERTAAEVDAAAPTSETVTTGGNTTSTGVIGAITGAAAVGGAAVASLIPGMASTEQHDAAPVTTETQDRSLWVKAGETAETAKVETVQATTSAAETVEAAKEEVKESVTGGKSEKKEEEGSEKPKAVTDHEAAVRTNPKAIPTAGGEKLGAAHEGESKVIPDIPPQPKDEPATVSSAAGQPDNTTADNTALNAGSAPGEAPKKRNSIFGKRNGSDASGASGDKPKFMDRLKSKLHLDKKDKA